MKAVLQWVLRTMMKNQTGIVQTMPKKDLVDFNVAMTAERLMRNGVNPNALKNANQVENALNQIDAAKKAEKTAKETFEGGGVGKGLPEIEVKSSDLEKGIALLDFLSENQILASKSEARRAISNKGIKIHNIIISDENKKLNKSDFKDDTLKLSYGKKKHYLIKII